MKKIAAGLLSLGFLISTTTVLAITPPITPIPIRIVPPSQGIDPSTQVGTVLSNALTITFIIAAIVVLFMLVWGAFQWILSGGDKEAVGKARSRITHALIGLAIVTLAFLIIQVVGQVLNINLLKLQGLPTLSQCGAGQRFNPERGVCETLAP